MKYRITNKNVEEEHMKNRILSILLVAAMTIGLAACGGGSKASDSESEDTKTIDASSVTKDSYEPETTDIVWAQGLSGNVLVTLATKLGYFEDVGLNVKEVPLDDGQLQGVSDGQVDIASNSGTNEPLQMIASGDDIAIIGGFMLEGCMPIIAKEGTEWNGPTDFVGKKVGGSPTTYAITSKINDEGYDINNDIQWVPFDNDADKISAILNGQIDYAVMGTGRMYMVQNTEGIAIMAYCDDVTPNYSCCRMVARNTWVQENPTTVKLLNEALLRAQCYFEANRDECAEIMSDVLSADLEYVKAYMDETEHYELNVATVKKTVVDNWQFQREVGLIDADLDDSVVEDVVYDNLYKAALDACVDKYYDDDPDFWDSQVQMYEELQ